MSQMDVFGNGRHPNNPDYDISGARRNEPGWRRPQTQPDREEDAVSAPLTAPATTATAGITAGATTEALLGERCKTHGSFQDNAVNGQALRLLFRESGGWGNMTAIQREALDMIAGKISRILSGQGGFADHWADIAGYAKLAEKGSQP